VLRACRRLLRPEGRIGFSTIVVPDGLSKKAHRRAVRLGPRAVASTRPLTELVDAAGFVNVETIDVTDDFSTTARAWVSEWSEHEVEVRAVLGDELDERRSHHKEMIAGIEQGLLSRLLVIASVP
jgi:hypothetical protein